MSLQNIYWLFYSVCVYDDAKCYISKLLIAFYRTPLHCWLLFSSTWMNSPASRSRRNHSITVTTCVYTVHVSAIGASFYSIFTHVPFPEVLNHLQYKDGCSIEPRHEELAIFYQKHALLIFTDKNNKKGLKEAQLHAYVVWSLSVGSASESYWIGTSVDEKLLHMK